MVTKRKIDGYDIPEVESVILDTETNEIVEQKELSPIEIMKTAAEKAKITILDPDPNCGKCFGRGYTGLVAGTTMPVACKCIFPEEDWEKSKNHFVNNRANRKRMVSLNASIIQQPKKNLIKSMGLRPIGRDLYKNKNGKLFTYDGKNFVKKVD